MEVNLYDFFFTSALYVNGQLHAPAALASV